MLVMGMALAGSASATTLLWLVCLKGTGLTKYTNEKCLTASGGSGEGWQSLGVPAGTEITVKILVISLLLSDTKVPIFGNVAIRCSNIGSIGRGVIKANGEAEVRAAEYTNPGENCSGEENCEKVEEVKGVNLPWKIKLFPGKNGDPLSKIEPGNKEGKEPGWKVKCKGVSDECTSEKEKEEEVLFLNEISATELLVLSLFQANHRAKCSAGGAEAGLVKGIVAILLPGGALSITTSP
jgi:hypothetical protein